MGLITVDWRSSFGWLCATLWRISSTYRASPKSGDRFTTERGYLKERGSFTLRPVGCPTDSLVSRLAPEKATRMSIKKVNGYWTIHSGEQPVMSCTSLEVALALVEQVAIGVA